MFYLRQELTDNWRDLRPQLVDFCQPAFLPDRCRSDFGYLDCPIRCGR